MVAKYKGSDHTGNVAKHFMKKDKVCHEILRLVQEYVVALSGLVHF